MIGGDPGPRIPSRIGLEVEPPTIDPARMVQSWEEIREARSRGEETKTPPWWWPRWSMPPLTKEVLMGLLIGVLVVTLRALEGVP